jgi:MFS family permease
VSPARRGAVAGCALGFATGWNVGNLGGVTSELSRVYGVGLATVGLFTTALFLMHMAMQIPGGKVTDRFGPRRAGAAALICIAVGDLVALVAAEPWLAIAGRAITGFGTAVAFVAGSAVVRESGGSPVAQGAFGGIGLGVGGLAIATVPQLEGTLGWRAPFWSSLALAAVAMALLLPLAPRDARRGVPARAAAGVGVLRDRSLHRLAALYAASFGLSVILGNWVVELLQYHSTLSDGAAAAVGSLTLLLGVITRPFGGWLLRQHPAVARPAVALSLVAGSLGTLAVLSGHPTWLAVVGGVLVGIGAGIPFAAAFTGAALARPDAPAAAVGLVNATANLVVLTGTPLVGLTFSLNGEGRIGFAVVATLWLAALCALPTARALGVRVPDPS